MNDSAPPPPAAPPRAVSGPGSAPHSWQEPTGGPYPRSPQAPAFDPRRAVGGAGVNVSRQGTNPVMAPPPMRPTHLGHDAPSPYAAPASFENAAYPGPPPHNAPTQGAQPAYAAQPYAPQTPDPNAYPGLPAPGHGYAPAAYDHTYAAPQPAYDYPQSGLPVEPAGGRASLLSKLTGRAKKDRSKKDPLSAGADTYSPATQWHDHSAQTDLAYVPAPDDRQSQANDPAKQTARKPFLMGLLTGIVVMLILGQVFRAASPSDDYAQALPPINMTVTEGPVSDDPEVLAFLDTVEGLN